METMDGHPSGRAPTRALGALFVLGALLSASTLLLPADPGIDRLAIGLLDVVALTAGVVLLTVGTRLPGPSIPALLGMAIVVIAAGAHYADEPAGGYVPTFFLWVGLYAGWFLSERLVAVLVAAVGSAYAVVLIIDPVETAVAHWLVVVGTTTATSGIVSVLVGQARRRAAELVRSEREGRAVLESAQEAYVIVDDHDVIVDVNPAAERTLGWPKDEARGQKVEIALTASSRRYRRDALRRFHEDGDASLLKRRTEVTFRHREGHEVPVEVTLSPIEVAGRQYFVSALHDISDRKAADRILDAQYQVRSVLAESRSFEDALLDLLRAQSESLGWDLGAYWALDEDTGRLRRLELWRAGDVGEAFAEVAELALSSAVGQVWETGQSRWLELEDEAERSTFARHGEAECSGLRVGPRPAGARRGRARRGGRVLLARAPSARPRGHRGHDGPERPDWRVHRAPAGRGARARACRDDRGGHPGDAPALGHHRPRRRTPGDRPRRPHGRRRQRGRPVRARLRAQRAGPHRRRARRRGRAAPVGRRRDLRHRARVPVGRAAVRR
jgi:PAS domain S-box-containing protein